MAPVPEEHKGSTEIPYVEPPQSEVDPRVERVVISGMSGLFPNSKNVEHFSNILYDKINPVTKEGTRWKYSNPELPEHFGKIMDLDKFDAHFFKVHYLLANRMDPMCRLLLEQTYQAIYDAGVNPKSLWGRKVGVFIGTSFFSESQQDHMYSFQEKTAWTLVGCSKNMFANRISYWLNLKSPSLCMDAACSSSLIALQRAYNAINSGECEAAIVGGSSIALHPESPIHYGRMTPLCMDGKTKSFDNNANGFARSESISILFLQKEKDAKRIYAEVCYINSQFCPMTNELGHVYGLYRDQDKISNFLKEFYEKATIQPAAVEFVEAFGSAVPEADKSELEAISSVLCKDRKSPLLVGSVLSNIGYTEAASGSCSVIKVLLGYHTGKLAANLHCDNPRDDVEALKDGRMRIVTEHQHFGRSYVAVNNMSVTGLNVHLLLKGYNKPKDLSRYDACIPHIVAVSGRKETAVHKIMDDLETSPVDPEKIGLLHNIHEENIWGHLARGYIILDTDENSTTKALLQETTNYDDTKRPLWFVFSGMGSQWRGMGTQLLRIPIFAAAIERCQRVLEPKGFDIVNILTSSDEKIFNNVLHSFVGITAVQIGLTDVLKELQIFPDNIIGHSMGELVCAYADGCLTAEETILSAYSRGLVSLQTPFIHGSMAAVGLGYKQIVKMCPPEIEVACHNSAESSTISGPSDVMREFVAKLTAQEIFAKEVPCSNIAYHSRYIENAGPALLKYLKDVIKVPKVRSERWLSTSVPQERWNEPAAKLSSPEYFTNNLLNPVLFEEASKMIPSNAVLVEVAPHGLLQTILKRSLPSTCINIPLTRRNHSDNVIFMLAAIGKLYIHGYHPRIKQLYPKIDYPVSTGTGFLSPLVEWNHEESWNTLSRKIHTKTKAAAARFFISLYDNEHIYLKGHTHGEEMLYPFSGALVCVWDTLAMFVGATRRDLSVRFENIQLHEQPRLLQNGLLRFKVQIQKGNGYFEVRNGSMIIANGYICVEEKHDSTIFKDDIDVDTENLTLRSQDIYKIFYSHNSFYSGEFQSIQKANKDMTEAHILWTDNWVTLIDSMLQLNTLQRNYDGISRPRFIHKLLIDVPEHNKAIKTNTRSSDISLNAKVFALEGTTRCGGVVLKDIEFIDLPSMECEKVALYGLKFTPFFQSNITAVSEALNMFIQVVAENINKTFVNIVEIQSDSYSLQKEIHELIDENPGLVINLKIVRVENIANNDNKILLNTADLVIARNINKSDKKCKLIYDAVPEDIFMLHTGDSSITSLPKALCRAVASAITPRGKLVLTRWHPAPKPHASTSTAISINNASDFRLLHSTMASLTHNQYLFVLCCYPQPNGLKELVQILRKEYKWAKVFIIAMSDQRNKNEFFFEQSPEFDLIFNTYNNGTWGGEYYFKSEKRSASMEQTVTLRSYKLGDLDSLRWEEGSALEANKIAVKVHYAGLNVRDAKRAGASIPCRLEDNTDIGYGYGMDFSGITETGERVMGVIRGGAASSRVVADPSMLWPVPAQWTLEDAATVPLPYVHAFYCLGIKTTIVSTTRLLVHGATGALGLAVISVALAHGCQVFATVNDIKKKRFLRNMFPNLPDDHIGNSRHESFGDMVLHKTKGLGCNIIICCLEGDLRNVALRCSGFFGITLDTQPMSCQEYYQFGMNSMEMGRNYVLLDLSSVFRTRNEKDMKDLQLMVCEGIKRGYVRPLPRITYEASEAAHALRLLAASRHRGRALLRLGDMSLPVAPRLVIPPYGGHLVLSATNDDILVGKVIDVLIERGAKNIAINLQQVTDEYIKTQFKKWQKFGAQIILSTTKIENAYNMEIVIRDCNVLAPVEAVYLIASHADHQKTQEKIKSTISDLDLVTRKLCPTIKLFALINEESNIGQDVCIKRTMDGLPSIMLNLPKLIKFGDGTSKADRGLSYKAAIQAIERAMCGTSCAVFLAQKVQQLFKYKLTKDIASIAGININESTPSSETLENLGVNISMCNTISEFIKEKLGLKIAKEEIPKLTIKRICSMASYPKAEKHKIKGLNVIFNNIDHDVILATHDLISLPTATNCTVDLVEVTDTEETYMIILPGLEGHHNKFFSLCECLKLPAVVLQPGFDYPNETVEEMAARLIKIVFKKIQPKKKFYLLGYSFGVLVALEMAAILEEQGLEGVVFCVDASPDTFPAALDSWLSEQGATDDTRLQDAIVQHMYALMASGTSQSLQLELHEASNWPQKVEAGVKALRDQIPLPSQYTRAVIAATYGRIEQARRYEAQRLRANPLRSLLVVLRSSSHPTSVEPDLSLSRYSVRVPQVYYLNTDHAHILEELRCANFVNQHLGKDILDAFQNRNICETY